MITVIERVKIRAPSKRVFAHVDDMRNLGWHMTERSSMAMLGSRLSLEILSGQPTGLATYATPARSWGSRFDFSESVTKYIPLCGKVWRTIGEPRLLIIASYEMRVAVEPLSPSSSRLTISIIYELPRSGFWRIVGLVLARSYSRWCLRRMCRDARRALEAAAMMSA